MLLKVLKQKKIKRFNKLPKNEEVEHLEKPDSIKCIKNLILKMKKIILS